MKKAQTQNQNNLKTNSLGLSPTFWKQIEFKLIEKLFYKCHSLPKSFDFGTYAGYQLSTYVASVGELSITSWMGLLIVVAINYVKTLVDDSAEDYECRNQPVDQLWGCGGHCTSGSEAHRYLSALNVHDNSNYAISSRHLVGAAGPTYISDGKHCYLFFFTYAFFCALDLVIFIYGV